MTTGTVPPGQDRTGIRRWRLPLRLRLTASYSALSLLAGGALLAITYLLVARALPRHSLLEAGSHEYRGENSTIRLELAEAMTETLDQEAAEQRSAALDQLLIQSAVALVIMTVVAVGLGWWLTGRMLRPLRQLTGAARELAPDTLHERIRPPRTNDELRDLSETFNGMLTRLQDGFEAQRRFVANASHELRTPLTVQRSAVDVALADPHPTVESLRRMAVRVRTATERHERLIDSLLLLARSQGRVEQPQPVDLATLADTGSAAAAEQVAAGDGASGLDVRTDLRPAPTYGDPVLLERLVSNLVDNAVRYNVAHGWVQLRTWVDADHTVLEVVNSGAPIPPAAVAGLFEPFRRHEGERTRDAPGAGLGLSIVAAVAAVHHGTVTATPGADGGLRVVAALPEDQGRNRG